MDEIEEMVMRTAYAHAGQNQLRAARLLGVSRNVVRARLLQFGALARAGRSSDGNEAVGPSEDEADPTAALPPLPPMLVVSPPQAPSPMLGLAAEQSHWGSSVT